MKGRSQSEENVFKSIFASLWPAIYAEKGGKKLHNLAEDNATTRKVGAVAGI